MEEIRTYHASNGTATYSPEDQHIMDSATWSYSTLNKKRKYMQAKIGTRSLLLARCILNMGPEHLDPRIADHINGDTTDYTRGNLRAITKAENAENRTKQEGASSKYHGVYYASDSGKWRASIIHRKKSNAIGLYTDEIEAARAVDTWIRRDPASKRKLNFPDEYIDVKPNKRIRTNQYRNVYKHKNCNNYYTMTFRHQRKIVCRFSSHDIIACARKNDECVILYNRDRKCLNFPDEHPDYVPIRTERYKVDQLDNDRVKVHINTRQSFVMDLYHYNRLKYERFTMTDGGYIQVNVNGDIEGLHNYLLGFPFVDHIDNNPLNNCISNLRISNRQQNGRNRALSPNSTTGLYGVHVVGNGKYVAQVKLSRNHHDAAFGRYVEKEHAGRARDLACILLCCGGHFKLNYNDWTLQTKWWWYTYLCITNAAFQRQMIAIKPIRGD